MEAYLDNAATTPVFPEVRDIMVKVLEEDFGNPSSKHTKGIAAEQYIKDARDIIAGSLKCQPKEIIFTSGGTESNNMAFLGTAIANRRAGKHINNEIGSVEPIKEIGEMLHSRKSQILFHVDAIQAFGKYKIVPKKMGIDMMSVSGHKIHGPKGTGFLYVRDGVKIRPILFGGGQQKGMRSGTENVPGIAGLGMAVKLIYQEHAAKRERLYEWKKMLIEGLQQYEGVTINGMDGTRLEETAPHIVNVSFASIKSEVMLHALAEKGVYVSSGSACSSNHPELSGTLQAIGVKQDLLDSTLRFSFSVMTTTEQIRYAVEAVGELLPVLRKFVRH